LYRFIILKSDFVVLKINLIDRYRLCLFAVIDEEKVADLES
jgi:hypothetical protein